MGILLPRVRLFCSFELRRKWLALNPPIFHKNRPNFCAIIQPDEKLFTKSIYNPLEDICLSISLGKTMPLSFYFPVWFIPDRNKQFDAEDGDDRGANYGVTGHQVLSLANRATLLDDVLLCPKCNLLVPTQAYSCIKEWGSNHGISHEENTRLQMIHLLRIQIVFSYWTSK